MQVLRKAHSRWWYARPVINGKRVFLKTGVLVAGAPGSVAFEKSRTAAQAAADRLMAEKHSGQADAEFHRRAYEFLTASKLRSGTTELAALSGLWTSWMTGRERSARYLAERQAAIEALVEALQERGASTVGSVSRAMAESWRAGLVGAGVSPRTVNAHVSLARGLWARLVRMGLCPDNPFEHFQRAEESTRHRRPYTADEMKRIVTACPDWLRGPVVTAACTAMRMGDCCTLEWASVSADRQWVMVRTAKTGETAEIPVFDALASELPSERGRGAVWPVAAARYQSDPWSVSKALSAVLVTAGIADAIAPFVPEKRGDKVAGARPANRARRANVVGFHSFRTTWITNALAAGVPMELVRRVTGHATVEVVLKHYFRPGREEFRRELVGRLNPLA